MRVWKIGAVALTSLCLVSAGSPAEADDKMFMASNGAELPAPSIAGLDCERMQDLLMIYSASNYRGIMPIPEDHADHSIFEYEYRLAVEHYSMCQMGARALEDPSPVFEGGFK